MYASKNRAQGTALKILCTKLGKSFIFCIKQKKSVKKYNTNILI